MPKNKQTGDAGEKIAFKYLTEKGYQLLACNYRVGHKEVDCIALYKDVLIIVEIKTRTSFIQGFPEEAVNTSKKNFLKAATESWVDKNPEITFEYVRYDIVSIILNGTIAKEILHIEDAFY